MPFADRLASSQIGVGLQAITRDHALERLVGLVSQAPGLLDHDRLLADLSARERRMSTGVGEGLALPHAWTPAVAAPVFAVGTFASPVDWNALDDAPVALAVMVAGPDGDPRARVRLLAHVSRVLSTEGTQERLIRSSSGDEMVEILTEAERGL